MTVLRFKKRPTYAPDPRNGEVYACECVEVIYVDGVAIETPRGFMWVHMSQNGGSAAVERGFETLAEADADAFRRARMTNAVYS